MKSIRLILASGILALFSVAAFGDLNIGSRVDSIFANDDEGNLWSLQDHLGKKNIVVYFYPAAMTGGCTKQACTYRDQSSALNDLDAVVVGVSGDSVNSLTLFKEANGLNFTLISDIDGSLAERFGVATRGGGSIEREVNGATHINTIHGDIARQTVLSMGGRFAGLTREPTARISSQYISKKTNLSDTKGRENSLKKYALFPVHAPIANAVRIVS